MRHDDDRGQGPDGGYALARQPGWLRYLTALALTGLVVGGRYSLDPWLGHQHNRHLLFLPAVMLAAWTAGFGPGVVSGALFTVALALLWGDPPGAARTLPAAELGLFLLLAVAVCAVIDSLQNARVRADEARRSHERLLEIVAHDLRNPLAAIKMAATSLARATPALGPRIERIERAATRMDDLIGDLVDLTRIEHGELDLHLDVQPVASMLDETVELFATVARGQEVTLLVAGSFGAARVACDRGRIIQVLSNLVGNALKFTPPGGRIELGYAPDGDHGRFYVTDTGPGIAAEDRQRVFQPYWRGDTRGTGLGLFIARTIVEAHGGRIAVESAPGAGATFWFTVRRAGDEPVDPSTH